MSIHVLKTKKNRKKFAMKFDGKRMTSKILFSFFAAHPEYDPKNLNSTKNK